MAYCTRADVVMAAGGESRLLELTDFDGDGIEDAGVVDDAISEADGLIDSYVRRKFEVPLLPVPESIRRVSANQSLYVLKSRRRAIIEADLPSNEARIKWLEDLSRGLVDPGINPTPTKSPLNSPSATARSSTKAVSREKFKGFS